MYVASHTHTHMTCHTHTHTCMWHHMSCMWRQSFLVVCKKKKIFHFSATHCNTLQHTDPTFFDLYIFEKCHFFIKDISLRNLGCFVGGILHVASYIFCKMYLLFIYISLRNVFPFYLYIFEKCRMPTCLHAKRHPYSYM